MTITDQLLAPAELAFVEDLTATANHAFRVLRETGSISASGTVQVNERVPVKDLEDLTKVYRGILARYFG